MSDIRSTVQQFYNEAGGYFSKTRQKTYGGHDATWAEMRPYLDRLSNGDSVLDLGCGNGRLLTGVKKDIDYTGIDFSSTLISEAKKLHPKREFLLGDIAKRDTWGKLDKRVKYDAVFCVATLHHLPEKKEQVFVLRQMNKFLKKDGFAYISVWNLWQLRYLKHHIFNVDMKIKNTRWLGVPFANKWDRFCFAFDKVYMARLVEKAGLELEELYYADKEGNEANSLSGRNLVCVVSKK